MECELCRYGIGMRKTDEWLWFIHLITQKLYLLMCTISLPNSDIPKQTVLVHSHPIVPQNVLSNDDEPLFLTYWEIREWVMKEL